MPVVTGIGHEPDTSIADMVADVRASTPTAAAEAASPSRESLERHFSARARSLAACAGRAVERAEAEVRRFSTRPLFRDPQLLFAAEAQTLDLASERLSRAIPANVERDALSVERQRERLSRVLPVAVERARADATRARTRLAACGGSLVGRFSQEAAVAAARLHDLSPLSVLGRGYAVARTPEGAVVRSVCGVSAGDAVDVSLADGVLACRVEGTRAHRYGDNGVGGRIMSDALDVKPVEELSFREAMAELDGIVGVLESNTLELEDSLASYERGVALLRALQGRLTEAQQKVDVLMGELAPEADDEARDTSLS